MAYMYFNGDKYFALQSIEECYHEIYDLNRCFEIDELMITAVASLCNKGYITEQSCSGHVIPVITYETIESKEDEAKIDLDNLVTRKFVGDISAECAYMVSDGENPGAFIIFRKEHTFNSLPKGWDYKEGRLSSQPVDYSCPAEYYYKISEKIINLEKWVESLPVL